MSARRSPITTHILDVSRGKPAANVAVHLEARTSGEANPEAAWKSLKRSVTNSDGRVEDLLAPGAALVAGTYRLTFETESYFKTLGTPGFYPFVTIVFEVKSPAEHYHVPLLLSPHGYSTYRGS